MRVGWNARAIGLSCSVFAPLILATPAFSGPSESLVASARAEGQLNVIALPRDWCGFGGVIDGFAARYGLRVNELRPDAASADEIEAIRTKRNDPDEAPDVIDVGLPFAAEAKRDGLLQPYKVSTWDTIPGSAKDADGYWYGDYFGVLAFEVNADLVTKLPRDWRDLLAPEYKGAVVLSGELTSNQAILAVFAAGLSATGGRVDGAAEKGMTFFAELNRRGNFNSYFGDSDSLADGRTPVLIRWDYLALGDRDRFKGKHRIEVVRPRTGNVTGVYVQAISAFAPHPNAARLWMEHLYSDEVQLAFLRPLLADPACQPPAGRESSGRPA